MATAMHAIGKLAVVLAAAVLLLGGMTAPVSATPRSQGVGLANNFIFSCTEHGGDPVVIMDSTGENLTVVCQWPDGTVAVCQFLPVVKECQWMTPLKVSSQSRSGGTLAVSK